jgi:hypothetical protein
LRTKRNDYHYQPSLWDLFQGGVRIYVDMKLILSAKNGHPQRLGVVLGPSLKIGKIIFLEAPK